MVQHQHSRWHERATLQRIERLAALSAAAKCIRCRQQHPQAFENISIIQGAESATYNPENGSCSSMQPALMAPPAVITAATTAGSNNEDFMLYQENSMDSLADTVQSSHCGCTVGQQRHCRHTQQRTWSQRFYPAVRKQAHLLMHLMGSSGISMLCSKQ